MGDYIFSKLFFEVYKSINNRKLIIKDYDALEKTLEDYLMNVSGYRIISRYQENFYEIKKYFENIVYNIDSNNYNIIEEINKYKLNFKTKIEAHYYTNLFIEVMKRLYSKSYDGKLDSYIYNNIGSDTIAISNIDKTFILSKLQKTEALQIPSTIILNIDKFERILYDYVDSIKNSDSYFNIFNNNGFNGFSNEEKIKILFESTILNASVSDLSNVQEFFRKYTNYLNDNTLSKFKNLTFIGNLFNDELYVMLKRAELEYETPYYLSFMLRNNRVTLPSVRLGIDEQDGLKSANIIATQDPQVKYSYENDKMIQEEIKNSLPKDSYFRFYKPTHLVSIIMTFGILNGLNIKDITVNDFMPFRYKKTILDKNMTEDESQIYQTSLTDKNLMTYMRLISVVDGIDIICYPELNMGLKLKLGDSIKCKNEFLQSIYDMGLEIGKSAKEKSI